MNRQFIVHPHESRITRTLDPPADYLAAFTLRLLAQLTAQSLFSTAVGVLALAARTPIAMKSRRVIVTRESNVKDIEALCRLMVPDRIDFFGRYIHDCTCLIWNSIFGPPAQLK
jgi:hypothetical protein